MRMLADRYAKASFKVKVDNVKPSRKNKKASYDCRQWRRERESYLTTNPLCVFCRKQGIIKQAEVVDHIEPHLGDERLFWDINNWQALCKKCHDTIKQRIEKTGF